MLARFAVCVGVGAVTVPPKAVSFGRYDDLQN
jgi:hypothetical protein